MSNQDEIVDLSLSSEPLIEPNNMVTSKPVNESLGALKLRALLNKTLRIEMSDGRILIGIFLCTDADANVILGSCSEYLPQLQSNKTNEEPRMLGLVMVPGKHIITVSIDMNDPPSINVNNPSYVRQCDVN